MDRVMRYVRELEEAGTDFESIERLLLVYFLYKLNYISCFRSSRENLFEWICGKKLSLLSKTSS